MKELISIVMTSYNYANYIAEAIESVINQTYKNWELIIIDDASTDNSIDVINNYLNDSRIKLYVNEKNLGLAESLKKGIDLASGNWIAFLESDDKFTPNSIEEKVKAISTDADLIFTDYEAIPNANCTDKYLLDRKKYVDLNESKFVNFAEKILYKFNIIPTFSVVMLKKSILKNCNLNSPIKVFVDWFLWTQLSDYKIYYINNKLTYWRRHDKSYISRYNEHFSEQFQFELLMRIFSLKNKNIIEKTLSILKFTVRKLRDRIF